MCRVNSSAGERTHPPNPDDRPSVASPCRVCRKNGGSCWPTTAIAPAAGPSESAVTASAIPTSSTSGQNRPSTLSAPRRGHPMSYPSPPPSEPDVNGWCWGDGVAGIDRTPMSQGETTSGFALFESCVPLPRCALTHGRLRHLTRESGRPTRRWCRAAVGAENASIPGASTRLLAPAPCETPSTSTRASARRRLIVRRVPMRFPCTERCTALRAAERRGWVRSAGTRPARTRSSPSSMPSAGARPR
jgi:hypothetical protein